MTQLFLQAVDVWLFRDGRPFDPGGGQRAESLFPPYPTVIQGAIRSHYLTARNVNLQSKPDILATVGAPLSFPGPLNLKGLTLRGPFLAKRSGKSGPVARYFPQPADAFTVDKDHHTLRPASPPEHKPAGVKTSLPEAHSLLGFSDPLKKGEEGLWLSEEALRDYLAGAEVIGMPAGKLFERESRIGIGMNSARQTVEEGLLYEVEFVRPVDGAGLLVEMSGYAGWPAEGVLQLGGESRAARFEAVQASAWPAAPKPLPRKFKVYFATPAYFESGWQPTDWSRFFTGGGQVTLRAAALNRYESLGGFDWAANPRAAGAHRASQRYVPAGSVYYLEWVGAGSATLIHSALTDFGAEIGFGQIIISEKEW